MPVLTATAMMTAAIVLSTSTLGVGVTTIASNILKRKSSEDEVSCTSEQLCPALRSPVHLHNLLISFFCDLVRDVVVSSAATSVLSFILHTQRRSSTLLILRT